MKSTSVNCPRLIHRHACLSTRGTFQDGDLQRWPHLKHVYLPEIDAGIKLLIWMFLRPWNHYRSFVLLIMDPMQPGQCWVGLKGDLWGSGDALNCEQPELSVNRVSVMNLDELWQQQFKTDFPECSMDEQSGMSREDQKFMELVTNSAKQVNGLTRSTYH